MKGKLEISYPCMWEYRIIGENAEKISEIVGEIMQTPYRLESKNRSSKGRFVSMHLSTSVDSEKYRNEIFSLLSSHPEIKMVI